MSLQSLAKKFAVTSIKGAMAVFMIAGLVGIPFMIISGAWSFLASLWYKHLFWFLVLLVPILCIAVKIWKWLYELLGAVMMSAGGIVDRLEQEQK